MANILSSKKRIIINNKQRLKNNNYKSKLKTYIKKLNKLLTIKKINEANLNLIVVQSLLDKIGKKNILHPNKCRRYKSNLMKKFNHIINYH